MGLKKPESDRWPKDHIVNKDEVLSLLEDLPDEFDGAELVYLLTLRQRLEQAEADLASGRLLSKPGEPPTPWEKQRTRHERTVEVLGRVAKNSDEWERRIAASEEARKRGEQPGIPFRQILEEEQRRRRDQS